MPGIEISEITPFTIATNSIKHLEVTLTKQVEDFYDKNFKSSKKEIEEDTRKWKDLPYTWVDRINSKIVTLTKSNLQIKCNAHKNPKKNFHRP